MTDTPRRSLFAAVAVLLVVGPSVGTAVIGAPTAGGAATTPAAAGADGVRFQQGTPTPTANASNVTVHEDPADAEGVANLDDLQQWLSSRIETALVDCARAARANESGTCTALAEEFPSLAARYAAVANETAATADDNTTRVLNRTAARQRTFVEAVAEYRATLDAYREARRQNDEARAAELAREVSREGGRVSRLGGDLSTGYETIDSNGTIEITSADDITRTVTANVSETTEEVRAAEFDPPDLTVSTGASSASFRDPVAVRGQLRSPNGTQLANRTVVVRTPGRTLSTRTDADGTFDVSYRPTTAPTGNVTVVARYVPRNGSAYTSTEARTGLSVAATEGSLEFRVNRSSSLAFDQPIRVSGVLRVDDAGVAGVPIEVTVGDVGFNATTDESGGFALSEPLPAVIPAGSRTLSVSLADADRAVTADPAETTLQVEPTTPRLAVGVNRTGPDTAVVRGRIAARGVPLAGEELVVRSDDETLATVTVGADGEFRAEVSLADLSANGSTALAVAYDPPSGGNLEPVVTRVEVGASGGLVPDIGAGFGLGSLSGTEPLFVALGVLAVLIVVVVTSGVASGTGGLVRSVSGGTGSLLGALFGSGAGAEPPDYASQLDVDGDSLTGSPRVEADDADAGETLLDAAEMQLRGERTDRAVVAAYAAARQRLESEFGVDPTLTHWELLAVARGSLDGEDRDALERLTRAYERAAFSSARSTTDVVNEALESAGVLVGRDVSPGEEGEGSTDD